MKTRILPETLEQRNARIRYEVWVIFGEAQRALDNTSNARYRWDLGVI